jgi:Kdo2-lipid IVA lauroyltransferase/acyltransferase
MEALFKLLARWPLPLLHGLGAALGWLAYAFSPTYRSRFKANSRLAGYTAAQVRGAIGHAGRMASELPRLWLGAPVPVEWEGAEWVEAAHQAGRGLIVLTPHLGCFEVMGQAYAQRYHSQGKIMTALYRPSRKPALQAIVSRARNRPGLTATPATLSGVKTLIKALRSGQTLAILPDQVPPLGSGCYAPFFGQSAYTVTLPARLAKMTGATILLTWGERLPKGAGYCVRFRPFTGPLSDEPEQAAAQINAAMESLIRECPQQYLWGYARYKKPRAELSSSASAAGGAA